MPEKEKKIKVKKGTPVAQSVPRELLPEIVAARIGDTAVDLSFIPDRDEEAELISADTEDGLRILRHSAAHLTAQAVLSIYKDAKLNAGPPTEDGFYYDIQMDPISLEDLGKIEARMKEISARKLKIERIEMTREDLEKKFAQNRFKLDKIVAKVKPGQRSTVYRQGDFEDFCTGPHVPDTSYLGAVKLLSVASTNYLGDVNREKMVRIYGTAFPDRKSLEHYLAMRDEALKRDHRKIGQEMDLFTFNSERAPGFPLYAPNGQWIRSMMVGFMKNLNEKYGWQEVWTPHLFKDTMWKQSGHYAKYKDNMYLFQLSDGDSYAIKPMNCPGHITIFERTMYSYRDLPVKYFEAGTVYRYEKSGEVGGLTRPRAFTIDDGHAFLRMDQMVAEITAVLAMVREAFSAFFESPEMIYDLSVIDKENYDNYLISYHCNSCNTISDIRKAAVEELRCPACGSTGLEPDFRRWDAATDALRMALQSNGIPYKEFPGEAAFYGPKIDIHVKDALGRSWQLSTVQLDFFMPINFELSFINEQGKKETPVMVHRAIYGSYERFLVILLESYAGRLPTWLSPLQCYVVPVSQSFSQYGQKVAEALKARGIRTVLDDSNETMNRKIRNVRRLRPSYIVVVGAKEAESNTVSVRNRDEKQSVHELDRFAEALEKEIDERRIQQTL